MKKFGVLLLLLFLATSVYGADSEVQDLTDIAAPAIGDDMYIVDDPDAAPASKKINIGALFAVSPALDADGTITDDYIDSADYAASSIDAEHLAANILALDDLIDVGTSTTTAGNILQAQGGVFDSKVFDGEYIQADTIDDDSIDFADVTCVDIDATDCGTVTSTGVVSGTGFTIGGAVIIEAELEMLDGITAGTAAASKALVLDASLDIATINVLTATSLVGPLTGEASTAAALAADPADCAANQFADAIDAAGVLSCNGVVDADVSDTLTASIIDLEAGTITNIASTEIVIGVGAADASYVSLSSHATMDNTGAVTVVDFALSGDGDVGDFDLDSLDRLEFFDAGLFIDGGTDAVLLISTDGTLEIATADWDISTTGAISSVSIDLEAEGITNIATTEIMVGVAANDASYVALSGDATMANDGVVTVVDDLHAHTSTSLTLALDNLSDVNSSTDTAGNIMVADGSGWDAVAMSSDATIDAAGAIEIAADVITNAEIADADQTVSICGVLYDADGDGDLDLDDDQVSVWGNKTANDFLITEIWGESDQTVSFDLQVDDGAPADVSQTDIAPAAGEAEDTSLDGDTTIAAGEEIDLAITSTANTPTWLSFCFTGNWVD